MPADAHGQLSGLQGTGRSVHPETARSRVRATAGVMPNVTVEGPVTTPPIGHAPWQLGQGEIPLAG